MARLSKGRVRQVLKESGGVIVAVAEKFGKSRQTIYNYLDKYDLWDDLQDARDRVHDVAESNIYGAVMQGDLDMSKFVVTHMPTGGRKKKWSSKQQVDANVHSLPVSEKTLALLERLDVDPSEAVAEFEKIIAMEAAAQGVEDS